MMLTRTVVQQRDKRIHYIKFIYETTTTAKPRLTK